MSKADRKKSIPAEGKKKGKQGGTKRRQGEDDGGSGLILAASEVTHNDVLFGRGCSQSPGNVAFRQLVAEKGDDYRMTKRGMKNAFAESLVDEIASRGGRFLVPVKEGKLGAAAKNTVLIGLNSGPATTTAAATTTCGGGGRANGKGADFWMVAKHDIVAEKVKQGLRDFVAADDKKRGGSISSVTTKSSSRSKRTNKRLRAPDDNSTRPTVSSPSSSSASMDMNINTNMAALSAPSLLPFQNSVLDDTASRVPVVSSNSSRSSMASGTKTESAAITTTTTTTTTTSRGGSTNTHSVAPPGITAAMLASQSFNDFLSTIALPRDLGQQSNTRGFVLPASGIATTSTDASVSVFPSIAAASNMNAGAGIAATNAIQHSSFACADLRVPAMRQSTICADTASRTDTIPPSALHVTSLLSSIQQPTHTSDNSSSSTATAAASLPLSFVDPAGELAATCTSTCNMASIPVPSALPTSLPSHSTSTTTMHAALPSIAGAAAQMAQIPQAQCPPPSRALEAAGGDDDFQRVLGWLQQ